MNLNWEVVRGFGNSTIVKSNYIWLFIIPLLTKNINIITQSLELEFVLPFSIARFFYASIFFVIGTLIYQIRCPSLIKENKGYAEFKESGKTAQHSIDYCLSAHKQFNSNSTYESTREYVLKFDNDAQEKILINLRNENNELESMYIDKELSTQFFWESFTMVNTLFMKSLYLCFFSYLIGCGFILYASIENVYYALQYFWK